MALPTCQQIIDDTAIEFGDPAKAKIGQPVWLLWYNEAREQITRDYHVLEQDATHDLTIDEDRYVYPDDCVQMSRWRYNATPSDPNTYVEAGELFEDEFREIVALQVPTGDSYFRYWARPTFFQITPKPTATVLGGGLITYWQLAARTESGNEPTTDFDLPPAMRRLVVRLMLIFAKERLHRYEEAQRDRASWEVDMARAYERVEDRSDDRRPRLRLETAKRPYSGMV
jgi:hypothetical protein